jgi:hypothetical protein
MKDKTISKEVALVELEKVVNWFVKKPVPVEELEETYPDVLEAIMDGLLVFNTDNVPTYKLKNPIKGEESGSVVLDSLTFKTRIKPTDQRKIAFGIDFKKDPIGFQHKAIAYLTSQPELMIDNYSRYDLDVIQQVSTLFM